MTASTARFGLSWVPVTTPSITRRIVTTTGITRYGWTGCSEPFAILRKAPGRHSDAVLFCSKQREKDSREEE
ncbi:hypothetical protein GW17_00022147 [Ensete ventricosum]|nr:hypothetical protein GW17_00022147 [Ensete ventricosum]RZR98140.1 hypothetical protein BHM03_00027447 [Ensete ventricosum]